MYPGPPYQWDVEVLGQESFDFDGSLYQLTVRRDEANYYTYLLAKMYSSVELYEKERILPKGVTPEELDEISRVNMRNSENIAIAVALQSMGYEVTSSGDGVLVVGLLDDSPVKDKLEKGDLITAILAVIFLGYFFKVSKYVLAMRATSFDQETSLAQGINVGRIFGLVWFIAGILAAFAGFFITGGFNLLTQASFISAFRALPAVVIGGLDSIPGAIVGSIIIGLTKGYVAY